MWLTFNPHHHLAALFLSVFCLTVTLSPHTCSSSGGSRQQSAYCISQQWEKSADYKALLTCWLIIPPVRLHLGGKKIVTCHQTMLNVLKVALSWPHICTEAASRLRCWLVINIRLLWAVINWNYHFAAVWRRDMGKSPGPEVDVFMLLCCVIVKGKVLEPWTLPLWVAATLANKWQDFHPHSLIRHSLSPCASEYHLEAFLAYLLVL